MTTYYTDKYKITQGRVIVPVAVIGLQNHSQYSFTHTSTNNLEQSFLEASCFNYRKRKLPSLLPTKEMKRPSRVLSTFNVQNVFNYKLVYVLDKISRRISDNLVSVAGIISPAEFFVFEQNLEKSVTQKRQRI